MGNSMSHSQPILALNAFDAGKRSNALPAATQSLVERRIRAFGPTSVLFYEKPLHVVGGDGVWLIEHFRTQRLFNTGLGA